MRAFAVPGWDVTTSDYDVALEMHKAPLSDKINLRTIAEARFANPGNLANMNKYLAERGDARVKDWASWVPNATFKTEEAQLRAEKAVRCRIHDPGMD